MLLTMLLNTIINLVSVFINKFTLSVMTLNNDIYLLFIAFILFIASTLLPLLLCSIAITFYHCSFYEQMYQLRIIII